MKFSVSGNLVDIFNNVIYPSTIYVENGVISFIQKDKASNHNYYIIPPFIDSHIHIESSMLPPSEFARQAVRFGTVATVSDPHEIANVLGIKGIFFMLEDGAKTGFKFYFGAPSCVPATSFETSGARITPNEIDYLFKTGKIKYLSEMMNFPGVINEETDVIKKLEIAKFYNLPIDGHSPGLRGKDLIKYISTGISTDHEAFSYDEAKEKIQNGMKILIREGSAAKNFDSLSPLLSEFPEMIMFCSDDLHPTDFEKGHINLLVQKAISLGFDLFSVLRAVSFNPVKHYGLDVGLLRVGDDADFIIVDDLKNFNIIETYIGGKLVAKNGESLLPQSNTTAINNFNIEPIDIESYKLEPKGKYIQVIEAIDGELITRKLLTDALIIDNNVVSNVEKDVLKLAVVNRYAKTRPQIGFIKNFGLKNSAIATSIAHDSHNIIAVGTSDDLISKAINLIIQNKGGISFISENQQEILPLPIAGLMSNLTISEISSKYERLEKLAKLNGSSLKSPFMTLSFMSLLVIPSLKLSDKGLFDVEKTQFTNLFVD
ncbi:MAG: adenine deaminase [Candidatus Kapaibacteriales bacterium]